MKFFGGFCSNLVLVNALGEDGKCRVLSLMAGGVHGGF